MSLAPDVMCGKGFYHTQRQYIEDATASTSRLRNPPYVNWLDYCDPTLIPFVHRSHCP